MSPDQRPLAVVKSSVSVLSTLSTQIFMWLTPSKSPLKCQCTVRPALTILFRIPVPPAPQRSSLLWGSFSQDSFSQRIYCCVTCNLLDCFAHCCPLSEQVSFGEYGWSPGAGVCILGLRGLPGALGFVGGKERYSFSYSLSLPTFRLLL